MKSPFFSKDRFLEPDGIQAPNDSPAKGSMQVLMVYIGEMRMPVCHWFVTVPMNMLSCQI